MHILGKGIGRELIRMIHEKAGLDTGLILLSAPAAVSDYPHIGMEKHDTLDYDDAGVLFSLAMLA
jgi:hypothetical protein